MDTKIISSSLIAVGIIAGAFTLGNQLEQGIRGFKVADRVVTVKGLSEKEVKANHVIWPVSFREMGNDLSQVYDQLEVKQNMVLKYLKDGGLTDEEITIAAPKLRDNLADNYGSQRPPFRYMITQVLTISSDKVDVVRKLDEAQRDLLKAGVGLTNDYSYMTKYSYTGLNEIKPAMIEAATKNAKEAAQKFAMDSGSTLGKIRRANQGIFSITDRDENTPFIKNVRVVTTVEYFLKD